MRMARREHDGPSQATPICRCRVLYLGSSVPQITKDGLQGIQEPLRELYPAEGAVSARGIDSWLSVWSNGLLLENMDENQKKVTRFFSIETLHYCAAVRYVVVSGGGSGSTNSSGGALPRFLPLDSPFARSPDIHHPPLFACILRRTTGIKVLECHAFICKRETPANALVRCCFHAYADSMYARSLEAGSSGSQVYDSPAGGTRATEEIAIEVDYTGDLSSANSEILPAAPSPAEEHPTTAGGEDEVSVYNGDENHKVWAGNARTEAELIYTDYGTLRSTNSSLYGLSPARPQRIRQLVMPSVAPPPPPSVEPGDSGKQRREVPGNSNSRRRLDEVDGGENSHSRTPSVINDRPVPPSANGTLNGHPQSSKGKKKMPKPRLFSSLAERKTKSKRPPFVMMPPPMMPAPPMHAMPPMGPPGPVPPHMMPPPAHPHMPAPMPPPPPGHPAWRRMPSREEPIYMPSSRPLSPTASYQPGHFPHEAYLMQHFANKAPSPPNTKRKKKKRRKRKDEDEEDIYGRKGHINERAFSQSIREEHRSRSYGSLVGVGASVGGKDREIMQMVAGLELGDDELERVEPRPGVYRPTGSIGSRASRR